MSKNIKMCVTSDEWYPVYTLDKSYGDPVVVSPEFLETYHRVMKEFDEIQKQLSRMAKDA